MSVVTWIITPRIQKKDKKKIEVCRTNVISVNTRTGRLEVSLRPGKESFVDKKDNDSILGTSV